MEEKPLLKPRMDLIFKAVFGSEKSKEILKSFLKAVLNIPEKISITIIDPNTKSEKEDDKTSTLDLRIETDFEIINVEIQLSEDPSMTDRVIYGISKTVTNQKFRGDDYKLKKVISIVITGYNLIDSHNNYHDTFNYHSKKTGHTFSNSTEIHTLELKKLPDADDGTVLWSWLKFIKSEERRDFEILAEKNKMVGEAVSILKEISADEAMRMRAYAKEMGEWRDRAIRIENEKRRIESENMMREAEMIFMKAKETEMKAKETEKKAKIEGTLEGELKSKTGIALKMIGDKIPIEVISKYIDMPIDWVEDLKIKL